MTGKGKPAGLPRGRPGAAPKGNAGKKPMTTRPHPAGYGKGAPRKPPSPPPPPR